MPEYEIEITPDGKVPGASFVHVMGDFWPYSERLFLGCICPAPYMSEDMMIVTVSVRGVSFPQFYTEEAKVMDALQFIARLARLEADNEKEAREWETELI